MNLLCHVAFLLLLGGLSCQNTRNAKPAGKPPRRTGGQSGEVAPEEDPAPGPVMVDPSKDKQASPQASASANAKPGNDMKLQLLKNAQGEINRHASYSLDPLCSHVSPAIPRNRAAVLVQGETQQQLQTGLESCRRKLRKTLIGGTPTLCEFGVCRRTCLFERVFVPYCSSDVWSGTAPKTKQPTKDTAEYAFMGSLIIREVIKDLVPKGIKQAKVVMLAGTSGLKPDPGGHLWHQSPLTAPRYTTLRGGISGTSCCPPAGGTGVLLNIEKVSSQLEQLGAEAQVRGLVDSGWFLESKQQKAPECPASVSCTPTDAIKKGLRLWNGVIPEKCRQQYKKGEEWQCFFGHKLYSSLTSPLFVVQWLFDEEQLRVENIQIGGQSLSEQQWTYMQNLGKELKNSLKDVTAVFAPSCLSHTLITKRMSSCYAFCLAVYHAAFSLSLDAISHFHSGLGLASQQEWVGLERGGGVSQGQSKAGGVVNHELRSPGGVAFSKGGISNWMDFQVKGTSLSRALQCWDKSLQEANRNSKTALKGCPFHLVDNCQSPQCNPTCPPLIDQTTQQELTLLQVLAGMGLDLQKLGLEVKGSHLTGIVSNGG
ncbi:hypothetical protein JZ751_006190 [Albula glossodonta]|uniref:Uncharacterized protein n=1 Tax=Albula glossodonta TaxID=121402 RepID=A0A8T2NER9_9TELE|nr:hypothetical protein JZ751_006190 [Albula glossodonta]